MPVPGENTPRPQTDGIEDHGCQTKYSDTALTMLRELSINSDVATSPNAGDFWAHAPDPEPWPERINQSPTPPTGDGIRNPRSERNFVRHTSEFTSRSLGSLEYRSHRPRRRRELTRREILEKLVEQQYLPRLTDPSQKPASSRNQHRPRPFYPTPVRTQRVYISPEELALIKRQRGENVGNPSFISESTSVIDNHPTRSSPRPQPAIPFGNDILQLSQDDAVINQATVFSSSLDAQSSSVNKTLKPQNMVSDKAHVSPDSYSQASTMLAASVSRTSTTVRSPISTPQWTPGCVSDVHSGVPTTSQIPIFATAAGSCETCPERKPSPLVEQIAPTAIYDPQTSRPLISSLTSSPSLSSYAADLATLVYPIDFTSSMSGEGASVQMSPRNNLSSSDHPVDFIRGEDSVNTSSQSPDSSNSLPSSHTTPYSTSLYDLIGLEFF